MHSAVFVILGATGDLSRHKLFPALYQLFKKKLLYNWVIIGAASSILSQESFHKMIYKHISIDNEDEWQEFVSHIFYQPLNFNKVEDFEQLNRLIERQEKTYHTHGNRVVYLAAAPHFFCTITKHCGISGVIMRASKAKGWQRIVYEKPFGTDLESAHAINECIQEYFDEEQVYRIDHYLTKELVSNIALIRFTNIIFEPLWNNKYIEYIAIDVSETIGVRDRGSYYDQYGVLKDVVQNHILQLLALIAMEAPDRLTGDFIRDKKARVLQSVRAVEGILGQYNGYRAEKNVAPHSQTSTFALLELHVETPRWHGVPFYVRTGKELALKSTAITIKFRSVVCPLQGITECPNNYLIMRISPEAVFSLTLNVKSVDRVNQVRSVAMEFCHNHIFGPTSKQAYEVLIEAILKGEKSVSVRFDEIESSWRVIAGLEQLSMQQEMYEKKTEGPRRAQLFTQERGILWQ